MGRRVEDGAGYGTASANQQAVTVIPWSSGITADYPDNDCECTWNYCSERKCFRLKFVNRYCWLHKNLSNG